MTVYVLTLTEKAMALSSRFEDVTLRHVVVADSRVRARMLAAKDALDEPASWWREGEYSTLKAIGYAPKPDRAHVVCTQSYHGA